MSRHQVLLAVVGLLVFSVLSCGGGGGGGTAPQPPPVTPPQSSFQETFQDSSGTIETFSQTTIDTSNPFFSKLGTNGRTCSTCHDASDGWTINATHLQQRFQTSQGADPIFNPIDGAVCPSADVSTPQAQTSAYSLLLNFGLIRMSLPVPADDDVQGQLQVTGTCTTCHNTPNVGGNSSFVMMNIGTGSSQVALP
ncbi:MAG: hypothetical protein WB755_25255, partial [Terriglobales bacterium]